MVDLVDDVGGPDGADDLGEGLTEEFVADLAGVDDGLPLDLLGDDGLAIQLLEQIDPAYFG